MGPTSSLREVGAPYKAALGMGKAWKEPYRIEIFNLLNQKHMLIDLQGSSWL